MASNQKKQSKPQAGPRYYLAGLNPDGAQHSGVPLRDLSADEFAALPDWLQASVDATPFYTTTAPGSASEDEGNQIDQGQGGTQTDTQTETQDQEGSN